MSVTRTITMDPSPEELAEMFCEMDSEEQAEFFNEVGCISKAWRGAGWCQQAVRVVESLDDDGKNVVQALAEHHMHQNKWEPQTWED